MLPTAIHKKKYYFNFMIWTSFAKVAFKIPFLRNTILREFYNLANFSLLFFRWRVAIAIELQLLQTPAWKSQKHTVLPHSQIVRVNNRVNRQIFANLSSSKGGSLTAASTSTTTRLPVVEFYIYLPSSTSMLYVVLLLQVMASFLQFHQAMICEQKIEVILANCC